MTKFPARLFAAVFSVNQACAHPTRVLRIPIKDHLRNFPQPPDVIFVFHVFQGEGTEQRKHMHDVVFPAHRERLITASPYFECLLAGDWTHADEVSIEDCQPGAFRILLRWVYVCPYRMATYAYRTYQIGRIQSSTLIDVLLAADRFAIKDLVSHLISLAGQILTMDLFREILDVLEHRQIGCANELSMGCVAHVNKLLTLDDVFKILAMLAHRRIECVTELTEECLKYFDRNTVTLMRHPPFPSIDHRHLAMILARSSLRIQEIDLYRFAIRCSEAQLKRTNKRPTHQDIRKVLGDALFLIRFPTMHPQEFTNGPARDNILSAEEKLAVYRSFHSAGTTECVFNAVPRPGASTLALRNFTSTYCHKCGAHLSSDICPECGCDCRQTVECGRCDGRVEVDRALNFGWHYGRHGARCDAIAYLCSCGAPNLIDGFGGHRCKRCGLRAWRCRCQDCDERSLRYYSSNHDEIVVGACRCNHCKDNYEDDE